MNYISEFIFKQENTSEKKILYDLNYIPKNLLKKKQSENNGSKTINGKNIIKYQYHFAIDIWKTSIKKQVKEQVKEQGDK